MPPKAKAKAPRAKQTQKPKKKAKAAAKAKAKGKAKVLPTLLDSEAASSSSISSAKKPPAAPAKSKKQTQKPKTQKQTQKPKAENPSVESKKPSVKSTQPLDNGIYYTLFTREHWSSGWGQSGVNEGEECSRKFTTKEEAAKYAKNLLSYYESHDENKIVYDACGFCLEEDRRKNPPNNGLLLRADMGEGGMEEVHIRLNLREK